MASGNGVVSRRGSYPAHLPRSHRNSPVDCFGARVRADERERGWASLVIRRKTDLILDDLDVIKNDYPGEAFYSTDLTSWYYLYVDADYGIYSTWYVPADLDTRPALYWTAHPEKRPGVVYVPFYESYTYGYDEQFVSENLEYIESVSDCTVTEGKAGYILKINEWKI